MNSTLKTARNLLILLAWIGVGIFLVLIVAKILKPAYISLEADCKIKNVTEQGYSVGGTFDPSTQKIQIYLEQNQKITDPEAQKALRHELTHARQFKEGRLATCDHKINVYLNEVEAYTAEYVP